MNQSVTKNTILKLLSSISSEKEIRKYLSRFSSDDYRFAVIKVGGAVIENDLENLVGVLKKVCKGKIFIKKQVKFNSIRIKNFDWNIISQQYLKVILKIL